MSSMPDCFELRIEPQGWTCEASSRSTLWRSARQAGVRLPSSCLNGTCRTCLCRLRGGTIRYSIEWPGVSQDEQEEGWILPCVAQPLSDVVLDVPAARKVDSQE
jgi:ferredoxin